jgi:hypothetical protein
MFKANCSVQITGKKDVLVKTVHRTFLQAQSVEQFRAAIKNQATRDPYERRLIIGFLNRMNAESLDAFVEFAKDNPGLAEIKTIITIIGAVKRIHYHHNPLLQSLFTMFLKFHPPDLLQLSY